MLLLADPSAQKLLAPSPAPGCGTRSPIGVPVPCASSPPTVRAAPPPPTPHVLRQPGSSDGMVRRLHGRPGGGRATHHGEDPITVAQRIEQSASSTIAQPSERTNPSRSASGDGTDRLTTCTAQTPPALACGSSSRSRRQSGSASPSCRRGRPDAPPSDPKNTRCQKHVIAGPNADPILCAIALTPVVGPVATPGLAKPPPRCGDTE